MLMYPTINPVLLSVGPLQIHWYGIMYLAAFAAAWILGCWRARQSHGAWTSSRVGDLIFYCIVGVVVGGRVGYVLFYNLSEFISHPLSIFKIWQGGMSFHGGCIGVIIAMFLFGRHVRKSFFEVSDFTAPLVPLGIAFGRLGNFINGELWGRVTDVPWAMVFPHVDHLPRHPSQLYEFLGEGILLFILVWMYSAKPKPQMAVSGLFSLGYGVLRFLLEFFRAPDPQYGFIAFDWLTMGQLLSIPMIIVGILMMSFAYSRRRAINYV